uniref:Uncharacterized protein n=1 Tax=Triticum urartu TaxID=4572 RepID=A0A8R7Q0Y4_TRIUA
MGHLLLLLLALLLASTRAAFHASAAAFAEVRTCSSLHARSMHDSLPRLRCGWGSDPVPASSPSACRTSALRGSGA